jgi:hypothetical protein
VEGDIHQKLRAATLIASGIRVATGQREDIASLPWLDLSIDFDNSIAAHKRRGHSVYTDLRFKSEQVASIWPKALANSAGELFGRHVIERQGTAGEQDNRAAYAQRAAEFRSAGRVPPLETTKRDNIEGDREWGAARQISRSIVEGWRREEFPVRRRGRRPNNSGEKSAGK